MRIVLALLLCTHILSAQDETSGQDSPSSSWILLSVHRVWTDIYGGYPNGGFGVNSMFSMNDHHTFWAGFSIVATGLAQRDALALNGVAGTWFVGDSHLGGFAFVGTGLGMSSGSGLTGFNFFSDPTLVYGLASQAGVGFGIEIFANLKIHTNAYVMWFTIDGGPVPLGVQLGLTFGGK